MLPANNDEALLAYYGEPGKNQTFIYPRFEMKLAWKPAIKIKRIRCHELAAEDLQNALDGVWLAYGRWRIRELGLDLFGGCLNVRRIRGGTRWSTHAFGAAVDLYPSMNRLRWGKDKAAFAKPEYRDFVDIMELHNFLSLGRHKDYDWMHFQRVLID